MNNSFSLIALDLRQQQEGHILKTLKKEIYFFDKQYAEEKGCIVRRETNDRNAMLVRLYGENIHVQAIVGKNGSGKSSILDIIYRVINNLSFYLLECETNYKSSVRFVVNLNAKLYYNIGDAIYSISCIDSHVKWEKRVFSSLEKEILFDSTWASSQFDKSNLIERGKELFYAVVTNYSPHALVSDDYQSELVSRHKDVKMIDGDIHSWLHSLFHKNDGYLTPICLSPFREINGAINMSKELALSEYRLSSIFLFYQYLSSSNTQIGDIGIIDSYTLHSITYCFNQDHAQERYRVYTYPTEKEITKCEDKSYGKLILEYFGFWDPRLMMNGLYLNACTYLTAKIYSIVDRYPKYKAYWNLFFKEEPSMLYRRLKYVITKRVPYANQQKLYKLLNALSEDHTHITIKLNQVISLLRYMKGCKKIKDFSWLSNNPQGFSYDEYIQKVHGVSSVNTIEEIQLLLPPPIFSIDISLARHSESQENIVSLADMSSGERQMLFVLSTYIYHVLNLKSIAQDISRVSYRNFFLILDEVEICFHPDYQRQFIGRLIKAIVDLGLNKEYSFNILLATHSPFILSDIHKQNILYLREGKDVSEKIEVNPFCANVNDILDQSFFMENGFSGEFATGKVQDLIKFLNSKSKRSKSGWTFDNAECFIKNIVGDPIIQSALLAMYNQKRQKCNG